MKHPITTLQSLAALVCVLILNACSKSTSSTAGFNCVTGNCNYVSSGSEFTTMTACKSSCGGTPLMVKDIDNNSYETIKIGNQTWMAANLKTSKYKDGTAIANVQDNASWSSNTGGAWCHYSTDSSYESIYGKMYNWYVIKNGNLCPEGWHIPNSLEWQTLINYLGGDSVAGGKIKSTERWIYPNVKANNETNFSALPGGDRAYYGSFVGVKLNTSWWSSTEENTTDAYLMNVTYSTAKTYLEAYSKGSGSYVRCIKN